MVTVPQSPSTRQLVVFKALFLLTENNFTIRTIDGWTRQQTGRGAQVRVGLTYDDAGQANGGPGVREVAKALTSLGHDVIAIGSATHLVDKLAAGQRFDVVLTCQESTTPATNHVATAALLEIYAIDSAFSTSTTLAICDQPNVMKSLLRDRGVPTNDYWLVETLGDIPRVDVQLPAAVSPALRCDASQRIRVTDAGQLSKACCQVMGQYGTAAMVETALTGDGIEVGLLGSGSSASVWMPENLPQPLASAVKRTALAAWQIVGGLDAGSMTLQCDREHQPLVTSIQPIPCLNANSVFMQLARAAEMTQENVLERIFESMLQRTLSRAPSPKLRPHLRTSHPSSATVQ